MQGFRFVERDNVVCAATVHTLTPPIPITTLTDGQVLTYYNEVLNTGALTVEVSDIAAKGLVRADLSPFVSGDLAVGRPIIIIYDETNDRFVAINFVAGGSGEIPAADLHDPIGSIPGEITGRRARGLLNHVALTKAQAEDDNFRVVKGTVDGKIISEAIDERLPAATADQDAVDVAGRCD